jgi:hypothetical protein
MKAELCVQVCKPMPDAADFYLESASVLFHMNTQGLEESSNQVIASRVF